MKKFAGLLGGLIVVLSFQNCSQSKIVSPSASNTGAGVDAVQISTKDYSQFVLWNPEKQIYLDVNLVSGKMQAFQQNGESLNQHYCLSSSEVSEVKTILANSEICEPKVDYEAVKDRMCTAIYKYPYASIMTDHTEYRLGEMNSGCDQPVDLCGDRAAMLKNFSVAIIKSLDSRSCN